MLLVLGGTVTVFGAAIGQLTAPSTGGLNSPMLAVTLPSDERQAEVLYAGLAGSV